MNSNLKSPRDEDILPTMIGVLEGGIEMAHQGSLWLSATIHGNAITPLTVSPSIDPKLRLEKLLVQIVSIFAVISKPSNDLSSSMKMPVSSIASSTCGNLQPSTPSQVISFG